MKTHSLLILSGALLSLAALPCSRATDFTEVVINPTAEGSTAQLLFRGLALGSLTEPAPGWTIGYSEAAPLLGQSEPLSVGLFRLNRPTGLYQWQFSGPTVDRLAMELKDDHRLVLHSHDAEDHTPLVEGGLDPDLHTVELRPGPTGGVFFNGIPLVSSADTSLSTSLTVGGGQLAHGDFPFYWWWGDEFAPAGLLAVGNDARAFGDQAVAIGQAARAGFQSTALGNGTNAQHHSAVLGWNSTALNMATAIGNGVFAQGPGSVAIGSNAFANHWYATALGSSAAATGYYSAAIGGSAYAAGSWAGAWGTTDGENSVALGGYTGAEKSFAAASGVTWGKFSVAIGRGTVAEQHYQVVLGILNDNQGLPRGSALQSSDPIFVIGNGHAENEGLPNYAEIRSNAFTVGYDGGTWLQGGLTVEGGSAQTPAASVFKRDVSVQGVLRVPESGDLSMGDFTAGTPP